MDTANANELNALLNRLLDEAEGEAATAEPSVPPPEERGDTAPDPPPPDVPSEALPVAAPPSPSAVSPLAGLLSNPAILSALPTVLENIGPLLGSASGGTGSAPAATRPHAIDRHTALLCAVKPYLSPERQNAADTVIRLCRVWDALERSGISLSGLLGSIPVGAIPADGSRDGR